MVPWKWPENYTQDMVKEWTRIEFINKTGSSLVGLFAKARTETKGSILMAHPMGKPAKGFFLKNAHADILLNNGYNVFMFDFNGFGESTVGGFFFPDDIDAALKKLKELAPNEEIGYFGVSLGASMGICALGIFEHPIKAAIFEGAFTSLPEFWSNNKLPAFLLKIFSIFRPNKSKEMLPEYQMTRLQNLNKILFIHCEGDENIPMEMTNRLIDSSNIPVDLWIIEGGEHTKGIQVNEELYKKKILTFYSKHLSSS